MELTIGAWHLTIERTAPGAAELSAMYDTATARWQRSIERLQYPAAYAEVFGRLRNAGLLAWGTGPLRILDGGIGTGALSLALSAELPNPLHVDGVDLSAGMLAQAQRALQRAGIATAMHQRSVEALPFAKNTFDLVMGAHVLEHVRDPQATLSEWLRVLKPGSPLVLVVSQPSLLTALIQVRWRFRAYGSELMQALLADVGVQQCRTFALRGWFPKQASALYVGRKPRPLVDDPALRNMSHLEIISKSLRHTGRADPIHTGHNRF